MAVQKTEFYERGDAIQTARVRMAPDYQVEPLAWLSRLRHLPAGLKLRSGAGSIPAWADYLVGFFSEVFSNRKVNARSHMSKVNRRVLEGAFTTRTIGEKSNAFPRSHNQQKKQILKSESTANQKTEKSDHITPVKRNLTNGQSRRSQVWTPIGLSQEEAGTRQHADIGVVLNQRLWETFWGINAEFSSPQGPALQSLNDKLQVAKLM
ncbi:hypothetical protein ANN_18306 [Periplaneta americana]|uniref:Uncharacterized protein n=1 Tax=Periplaneta americana TaxID=6978 RepID=A0ABQ8SQH4_PERAM|nr:hypothetical protein ANN_18306 [Periplaneta americana]